MTKLIRSCLLLFLLNVGVSTAFAYSTIGTLYMGGARLLLDGRDGEATVSNGSGTTDTGVYESLVVDFLSAPPGGDYEFIMSMPWLPPPRYSWLTVRAWLEPQNPASASLPTADIGITYSFPQRTFTPIDNGIWSEVTSTERVGPSGNFDIHVSNYLAGDSGGNLGRLRVEFLLEVSPVSEPSQTVLALAGLGMLGGRRPGSTQTCPSVVELAAFLMSLLRHQAIKQKRPPGICPAAFFAYRTATVRLTPA